jgi:hypothetical protein
VSEDDFSEDVPTALGSSFIMLHEIFEGLQEAGFEESQALHIVSQIITSGQSS